MRLFGYVIGLALVLGTGTVYAQEKISVEQAVDLALKQNYRLRAVEKRSAAAGDVALSQGARLLPSVHLSEEAQWWNCQAAFSFADFAKGAVCRNEVGTTPPPNLSSFSPAQQMQLGTLLSGLGGPPIIARDSPTNSFVASVDVPLLGLLHTGFDYGAQRDNAKAAQAGVQVSKAQIVQAVRTAFLQLFEAQALEQIAGASVSELDEQVKVARARLKAGVITNADLLRVQVAEANARQQQIAARTQGMVTKANLLDAIGLKPDAAVVFTEPTTLLEAAQQPLPAQADATSRAEAKRPEVQAADLTRKSAEHTRTARYLSLLPELDGEGAYVRTDGQLFAPANQWFIGLRANWAVWEWGATFFQARAAGHQAAAADIDAENQRRAVAVEVQNALAQTEAAAVVVDVARATISSAQEAYRVEQALLQAGSATTTDLLDAQSALTTARLNLARAQYELAIQRVALARVTAE